jgi:hypothetical protein
MLQAVRVGSRAEAKRAERERRVELTKNPPLPATAFSSVVAAYPVESAEVDAVSGASTISAEHENHILPVLVKQLDFGYHARTC